MQFMHYAYLDDRRYCILLNVSLKYVCKRNKHYGIAAEDVNNLTKKTLISSINNAYLLFLTSLVNVTKTSSVIAARDC